MNFFDKRPLSLILCILLGAFVFFSFGDISGRLVILSLAIIMILLSLFSSSSLSKQRYKLLLSSSLIIIASLLSYLYFNVWFYANERYEEVCEIEGVVESVDFDSSVNSIVVKTESINGDALSSYRIKVDLGESDITNITTSTKVIFSAKLDAFYATEDFDEASYYYSRGYNAEAYEVGDLRITGQEEFSVKYKISEYRKSIARKLVLDSSAENGGLLAALLLGERDFLSGQTKLDFNRIGITHILALSGMHLAILCYGLSRLLSFFGIDKRIRKVGEIIFAILYMALTGFPVSVVRAGFMLIISSLLFLLSSSKDHITNLFLSVTIIVLIEPYSVFDTSLWLSAFATLGIIICSEIFERSSMDKSPFYNHALSPIFTAMISSAFAIVATLALTHFQFGKISSLSLISTVIFSPIILLFMYLGTFFMLTAFFIPLERVVNIFGDFIRDLAHLFSSYEYAQLSTNSIITEFLVITSTVAFFLFLIIKIDRKRIAALTICALLISSIASAAIYTASKNEEFEFTYSDIEESERILMKSDSVAALIEISTLTPRVANETVNYLSESDVMYLDDYIITSYDSRSINALRSLLSKVYVKNLYIPAPKSDIKKEIYTELLDLKNSYSIKLNIYTDGYMISLSDFAIFPIYSDYKDRCAFTVLYDDRFYTYVTADMLDAVAVNHALKVMNGADTVIIGSKGESYDQNDFNYKLSESTKLIYNKKAGLTAEALKYYENRITVDPSGSIDLYVE